MKIKKILIISLILLTLSLTAVSANDLNDTNIGESSCGDDSLNSSLESVQLEETYASTQPGTFKDLQVEINNSPAGSVLNLSRDYNGAYGTDIQLNKDLTINGQGHTLDCLDDECMAFYSSSGNIVLKNLTIKNGHSIYKSHGGAIYIEGSAQYTIENCIFEDNWAYGFGGAIYNRVNKPLSIINSQFNNNKVKNFAGGAIYSIGDLNIQGSTFTSNNVPSYGGAIFCKSTTNIDSCLFESNMALKGSDGYGGAIYSQRVEIKNSTFNNNQAYQAGGAIYAEIININNNLETEPFNTFFTGNKVDMYGGALYAKEYINAVNTIFSNNGANYGGAAFSRGNINVRNCLFEYNNATNNVLSCEGGAIRSEKTAIINNVTFKNNYANNKGGAVYAKDVTITDTPSFFEGNTAKKYGGAIYTDKFNENVRWASFINNDAYLKDGGAIYINKENHVIFSNCYFERNKCGGEGGAIYFDSRNSGVVLRYNIFIDNSAGKKGEIVYTCGKFNEIKNNWYGSNNPVFTNKFTEWHWPTSDEDHSDADPVKTKLSLSDIGQTSKLTVDFISTNSNKLDGILYGINAKFNADNGATITNHQIGENSVTSDITFNNDGITTVTATINKQILKLSYSHFKENVTMNITAPEITMGENSTVKINFTPNTATGTVTVGNISSNIENGTAIVIIPNLPVGSNTLFVEYAGDYAFNNASASIVIVVNPIDLNINANAIPIHIGDNATVIVSGLENATGNVTVSINNNDWTGEIIGGTATVIVPDLTASVTANVTYAGDYKYHNASTTVDIIVNTDPSKYLTIDASAEPVNIPEDAIIIVSGLENATGNVTVSINNNDWTGEIIGGTATVIVPDLTASVTANVTYAGDYKYHNASTTVDIVINPPITVWYVDGSRTSSGDGRSESTAFKTLKEAISKASDGNTIYIMPNTYIGSDNVGLTINKNLNIIRYGVGEVILDAEGLVRILTVNATSLNITGLTFKNGIDDYAGGAIFFYQTLENSIINATFINNTLTYHGAGGAIAFYCDFNNSIINADFINNTVISGAGGAIYFNGNLNNVTIEGTYNNNTAEDSGGVFYFNENLNNVTIEGTYNNNAAEDSGGVFYFTGNLTDVIVSGDYANNTADYGGIYYICELLNVNNSIFSGNYDKNTANYGAVIFSEGNIVNSKVYGNYTNNNAEMGIDIILFAENVEISGNYVNNTISDGGVIYMGYCDDKSIVHDSIFINNNVSDEPIISALINPISALNNWFGNNATNYNMTPNVSQNVTLINWLFLNATTNATELKLNDKLEITFKLYSYNNTSEEIAEYDASKMNIKLDLTQIGGKLTKDAALINETVMYTFDEGEIASVTGRFENASYTLILAKASSEIIINKTEINLGVNQSVSAEATLKPEVAGNLTYTSNDTSVAIVENGVIKALAEGTATITVSFAGNEYYSAAQNKTINVVVKLNGTSVTVNNSTLDLKIGDTFTIVATTVPDGLDVTFVPDNSGVVSVDENGVVTALKAGTATIVVKVEGDDHYAESSTNVIVTVSKVFTEIILENDNFALNALENISAGATLNPAVAGNLTYTSNDTSVAIVENGVIKALAAGTATITVSFAGNELYDAAENQTINVTVRPNAPPVFALSENKNVAAIYSAKANYKVLVTRDGKAVGAGETVTIKYNGKTYYVKTDKNGYVTLSLNTKVKVKKYTITATYKGVKVTNKVTIKHVIKAGNKKVKKSRKVTKVKVSLKKVNGKYLKGKVLKIKFNKKTYKVKTNKKGVATWKVKKSMLKKLKAGKKYKYKVTCGKDVVTKKLTIKK